jgi:YfiR/HmsC-like
MERRHSDPTRHLHQGGVAVVKSEKRARCSKMLRRRRFGWIAGALIACAITTLVNLVPLAHSRAAQVSPATEYELKAAFLFNFIKFTEWPDDDSNKTAEPFVISVVGKDPFGAALDKVVEGETIHNRKIVVRRFARMDDLAATSQLLFISASEERNLAAIVKLLEGQAVLTISEITSFSERGGVIELKKDGSRIVFEVNVSAAKRAGLSMNAQLLKLAKAVRGRS